MKSSLKTRTLCKVLFIRFFTVEKHYLENRCIELIWWTEFTNSPLSCPRVGYLIPALNAVRWFRGVGHQPMWLDAPAAEGCVILP